MVVWISGLKRSTSPSNLLDSQRYPVNLKSLDRLRMETSYDSDPPMQPLIQSLCFLPDKILVHYRRYRLHRLN